jgi:hypothetical protein
VRWRVVPLAALAGAVVINVVQTLKLGFPTAPSGWVPTAGAVAGFALAAKAERVLQFMPGVGMPKPRNPAPGSGERAPGNAAAARAGRGNRRAGWVAAAALVAVSAALAIPAHGFVERHADTNSSAVATAVGWLARDRAYRNDSAPVATTPAFIGPLAGDRLQHRLTALPPHATCAQIAQRARTQYLVVYGGTLGGAPPQPIRRCLPIPDFDNGLIAIYRPH